MELSGEQRIEAPRAKVWEALNDPATLRACIPGCQSLEQVSDDQLRAIVGIKMGPITARFEGDVTLSERDPPNGYRIAGEGRGGAAGSAKGGARVRLRDDGAATILAYEVSAEVGGKIAQLGGGLIDATAKQLAGAFFKRLAESVGAVAPPPQKATAPAAAPSAPRPAAPSPAPARPLAAPVVAGGVPTTVLLLLALAAAAAGFLAGLAAGGWNGNGALAGLAAGLLVVVTAGAAFGLGQRSQGPAVVLDARLLARLAASLEDGGS